MSQTSRSDHTLQLDSYVPALVNFLANKLSSGASRLYRNRFGVGIVEWRLLAMLKVENNIPPNRMCQVIGLDKAAVSRSLKQMHNDQLVTLQDDPADARQMLVSLTDAGREMHDRIFELAIQREQLLLAEFSDQERAQLIDFLNRLNARVGAVNAFNPD